MAFLDTKWVVLAGCLALAGCNDTLTSVANKAEHPLPKKLVSQMKAQGMSTRSPIMMRIFKEEGTLEVWKQKPNGRYEIVTNYAICKWSGTLGPKFKEGDRQAPEGFYRIHPHQMNPNSSYYLSFNMGFPNRYDRSHGRTGSNLMVHGACSSAGCYSMTDEQVLEIFGFARDAFKGGQKYFQVQAYPFRLTAENMARHRDHKSFKFWNMLKEGYDHFEITKQPPKVEVCGRQYVFNQIAEDNGRFRASAACPQMSQPQSLQFAHANFQKKYEKDFAEAVAKLDKTAAKEQQAEVAKIAAQARAAERAEIAEKRNEQLTQAFSPVASIFSRKQNSDAPRNTGLAANLYKTNQVTQPDPTTNSEANTSIAPQEINTADVPVPTAANATIEEKTPRWKFWKRKSNSDD
ncbi:L,D-transpeptidase family protein [Lentilitoribacter sp. EG35]|jgi:murein L,D-transpeptidase YafK|uniref:L,D-transpeptidase family protein n=1 Tax=Lentilitoribacter sp. EG35 TaxID=3234192 RepID=UPI00345FB5B9